MKLKVNDKVIIISGKNKGKTGKILKTFQKDNKLVVEKVNLQIKYTKKKGDTPGQKKEQEGRIDASNVMILCPKTNKPSRIGYRILKNSKKERYAKVSGEALS